MLGMHKTRENGTPSVTLSSSRGSDDDDSESELEARNPLRSLRSALTDTEDGTWMESKKLVLQDIRKEVKRNKVTLIEGNLYTYWAFLDVMRAGREDEIQGFNKWSENLNLQAGLYFVMFVQIIGPPAVLIYTIYAINWSGLSVGLNEWRYEPGSMTHGVSNMFKRVLSSLLIFVFNLNGTYVIQKDQDTSRKIAKFAAALAQDDIPIRKHWLWVGAMVNCWVVVVSSISMAPCFILAKSPKQVIFDAFALLFLFRLDDVCGDLGFMQDQWETEAIGTWYDRIVHYKRYKLKFGRSSNLQPSGGQDVMGKLQDLEARLGKLEMPPVDTDSSDDESMNGNSRRRHNSEQGFQMAKAILRPDQWTELTVYKVALLMLALLTPLVPAFYIFVEGVEPKHFGDRNHDLDETLSRYQDMVDQDHLTIANLKATVDSLTALLTATPTLR